MKTALKRAPIRIIAFAALLAMLVCLLPEGTREALKCERDRTVKQAGVSFHALKPDCEYFVNFLR